MTPTPRTHGLRLICATGAVLTTAVIGLVIHSLARAYDMAAEAQAVARSVVVAHAQPR